MRAQGMTEWQILTRVELPLALPLIFGGIRNAALQVIATVTVVAYTKLALLVDVLLAAAQRLLTTPFTSK